MNKSTIFLAGIFLITICLICIKNTTNLNYIQNNSLKNTYTNQPTFKSNAIETNGFAEITINPKGGKYTVSVMHNDNHISTKNIENLQLMTNHDQNTFRNKLGNPLFIYTNEDMTNELWVYRIDDTQNTILLCSFKNKIFFKYNKLDSFIDNDILNVDRLSNYINVTY